MRLTTLIAAPSTAPMKHVAASRDPKVVDTAAQIVDMRRVSAARSSTGLLPTASDNGTHRKAPMPKNSEGAESKSVKCNGAVS